ncbi:uncharacterized protein CANTADRAFT_187220 [Suhomyces tanzawaensis NRRL Y-17324]|uniref:Uncharacterized protein n=1 Tax=Suhomyces tanzawaensis NRRL Y-17324 TaxID=984487 RepID=A0A1E4SNL1_9ASCO|nr:uncharacterized protein CANTADRAFT_187220 [Suhomyces tanzawaensis NRRL Y-17324]ODV81007.1 hypothetical protein CANTADRAFT_187220 [Suhomyces tanzawaensis NRRL Y-17324]
MNRNGQITIPLYIVCPTQWHLEDYVSARNTIARVDEWICSWRDICPRAQCYRSLVGRGPRSHDGAKLPINSGCLELLSWGAAQCVSVVLSCS